MKPSEAQPATVLPRLTRKQKRMLQWTFLGFVLAAGAGAVYDYVSSAPQRAQEQFQDAMKLMKPGHYDEAIAGLTRAIHTWSGLAEAYLERANAEHVLGRDEDAIADFQHAADLSPDLYRAWAALGAIYGGRRDYQRAAEFYSKSIAAKPNVDAFFERGQMYESLGEHQKAIQDYDRAILEMPDAPAVYRARSLARREIGDEAGYAADRDAANQMEHRH